jgi:hypothetical protein
VVPDAVSAMSDHRTDDPEHLKPLIDAIQKSVANDGPVIAAMTSTTPIMWSSRKWTGFAGPGKAASIPGVGGVTSTIPTILNLTPSGS